VAVGEKGGSWEVRRLVERRGRVAKRGSRGGGVRVLSLIYICEQVLGLGWISARVDEYC